MISRIPVPAMLLGATFCLAVPATAQAQEFVRPPYTGAYEPQGVDERGLWMEFDEIERALRDSPTVVHDQRLTNYVRGVLCRAVGDDRCDAVRTYILKDSSFNAAMAPNGLMIVHTGLLARVHSEAELAAVLGHEFGHFEKRHSLDGFRKRRTASDIIAWVGVGGAYARTPTASIQNSIVYSYYTFNRAQESEADAVSVGFLRASPYRLRGSRIWQRLTDEENALRKERGLRKLRKKTPNLLDTHPTKVERAEFHTKMEAETGAIGEDGFERYKAATAPYLKDLFDPLIRDNDFGAADYVITKRGEVLGWDAQLYFLRGELYRLRGHPRDFVAASDFFRQAIALPDAPAESWRGLGLCAMRTGDIDNGRAALVEYVKRMPDATDIATITLLLGT